MSVSLFHLAYLGPGGPEFLLIMLVLLVMFGAKDAPRILRKLNEIINQVRNTADSFKREVMYGDLNAPVPPAGQEEPYDADADYCDDDVDEERKQTAEDAEPQPEAIAPEADPEGPEEEGGDAPKV
jgi:Sec-independent protein translocase protein TatA